MAPSRPPWRRAFDTAERAIGRPLEAGVNTAEFATFAAMASRARRSVGRSVDGTFAWWLHRFGLPARRDVRQANRGIARLESAVNELSRQLDEIQREARRQDGAARVPRSRASR